MTNTPSPAARRLAGVLAGLTIAVSAGFVGYAVRGDPGTGTGGPGTGQLPGQFPGAPAGTGTGGPGTGQLPGRFPGAPAGDGVGRSPVATPPG